MQIGKHRSIKTIVDHLTTVITTFNILAIFKSSHYFHFLSQSGHIHDVCVSHMHQIHMHRLREKMYVYIHVGIHIFEYTHIYDFINVLYVLFCKIP